MEWSALYTIDNCPTIPEIATYIDNPLWAELCTFIEKNYAVLPSIEYSGCAMAPGFNVKYKKAGKSLCTLYPKKGYFTCLVVIGNKDTMETEFILPAFDPYLIELYNSLKPSKMGRWMMIDVTSTLILDNAKELIQIRRKLKK